MAEGIDPFFLTGGNKRGRPELGVVDPLGMVAYPVTNKKNIESSVNRFRNIRPVDRSSDEYDRSEGTYNVSGFRNVSNPPFLSPGFDRGEKKIDRAIISLEGTPAGRDSEGKLFDRQTLGVSNVIPMDDPRFIIETAAQKRAMTGPRQRLAFGAGESSPEVHGNLFSGVLEGLGSEFQLVRNKYGDAELVDMEGNELPSITFNIYDLIDKTIANSRKRWARNNREYRTDTGQVWRDTFPEKVTGSIDPLLRLPNEFFMEELGDGFEDRWINHTDDLGYTYEGVPIPSNFAVNEGDLGLDRAVLTSRGFHFLPEWANNRFQPILDAAMVGDVIRSEEDCFEDAWSVAKEEEPPEYDDPLESWRDDQAEDEREMFRYIMENATPLHPGFIRNNAIHPYRWTKGEDADFYIQLKGNNAGQVLDEPIANSIGVATNPDVLLPDFAKYLFMHIHNTGAYKPYIGGSVVPFIRQGDLDKVIVEQMQNMWGGK